MMVDSHSKSLVHAVFNFCSQACSLVKEQKRELVHKDSLIRILATQRDESLATLKRHGLSIPQQLPSNSFKMPYFTVYKHTKCIQAGEKQANKNKQGVCLSVYLSVEILT